MFTSIRLAMVSAFVIVLGVADRGVAADVQPNKTHIRAQQGIEDGAGKITKLAYVSSRSHTKVEYVSGKSYKDDSFSLTYKFSYRDNDNDPQTYTLRFAYDKTGKMTDIATVNHSSFWEPFNALKIAGAVLDGVSQELNK